MCVKWMNWLMLFIVSICIVQIASDKRDEDCTEIARDDAPLLVFSTLGGGLTAVDPITSEIRWRIEDEPAVKVPTHSETTVPPYLPDPRDGSLYQLGDMGGLKKLPYTIPQLVASAPCRSSDGILYSGKKKDTWFLIDPKTGRREKVVGFGADSKDSIGWATSKAIYLGRTQYTVLMYDSTSKDKNTKPWNVTFYDYSSHSMAPEVSNEYEYLHLCASGSGLTVTMDKTKGTFMWQRDLSSPVVAAFLLGPDGLLSVPFTTVSDGALKSIIEYAKDGQQNDIKLFQSLYVGEHIHGLYALPELVDRETKTISAEPHMRLIDGPHEDVNVNPNLVYLNSLLGNTNNNNKNVIVLGHYQMPKLNDELKLSISPPKFLQHQPPLAQQPLPQEQQHDPDIRGNELMATHGVSQPDMILNVNKRGSKSNIIPPQIIGGNNRILPQLTYKSPKEYISKMYRDSQSWLNDQESKILKVLLIILFGMIIAMFWYLRYTVRELRQQSQTGSQTLSFERKTSGSFQELIEFGDGLIQVGKITFNPKKVLGKGCEGTYVFEGTFDKRSVAVKRLLPDSFTLADREVALLRESDAHENVVRYFCTEQDRQFRYIAVELCLATLHDFIEGKMNEQIRQNVSPIDMLQQATNGLMHLHTLRIVHRDIKPQNVLLSLPNPNKQVRVMISDFGLCKKLNHDKASLSRRSGVTGTHGWIAPEIMKGQRTTTSVDIFSLGCVFYYVISRGSHPFGDVIKRQSNILSHEFELKYFYNSDNAKNSDVLAEELIKDMINKDSSQRPTAEDILKHPFFWNAEKILNFLQDVSDRVEKLEYHVEPLKTLEKNSKFITRDDWNLHLDPSITSDLKKYRGYHGNSVRDLLRALRNKKHHYHELTSDMQFILGALPTGFTSYWISRFPRLLSHSYHSLQLCSNEHSFLSYYSRAYMFSKPSYFYEETEDFVPTEQVKPVRGSPKNYIRYKQNDTFSGNITRTLGQRFENFRSNKKGAYNFHRNNNNGINIVGNNGGSTAPGGSSEQQTNVTTETEDTEADGFKLIRRNVNTKRRAESKIVKQEHVRWILPNENNN